MSRITTDMQCTISAPDYVYRTNQKLPLLKSADTSRMGKHECPLCGGDLVPMGWFRAGGLHELLHKCERCGMAVFR
ncbi:hypothetical protein [Gordonibacter massiliensis (ex Traore et al. 2017)]|uniref:hypothetical protein n=1 Tax=Gordonibacter massiliensis (ex Traore et al. 2017) TaxID=1841863 RepID=UPI001C8C97ED|nr:hypothetical protein [Gordonibacter massiliensis (ex Traore et al. 2017)]